MKLSRSLKNIRNQIDFTLRNRTPWGKPVKAGTEIDQKFQIELREFLQKFSWAQFVLSASAQVNVLDVGTKNFASGPIIENHLLQLGLKPATFGIEIDGYRRLRSFHTRADYGRFYASQMKNGHFHVTDFLEWERPAQLILLLNPFVTESPLLNWGLPLEHFKPERLFRHCGHLLPTGGVLILSNPTQEEQEISLDLAKAAGFSIEQKVTWQPRSATDSAQKRDRLGTWLRKKEIPKSEPTS